MILRKEYFSWWCMSSSLNISPLNLSHNCLSIYQSFNFIALLNLCCSFSEDGFWNRFVCGCSCFFLWIKQFKQFSKATCGASYYSRSIFPISWKTQYAASVDADAFFCKLHNFPKRCMRNSSCISFAPPLMSARGIAAVSALSGTGVGIQRNCCGRLFMFFFCFLHKLYLDLL